MGDPGSQPNRLVSSRPRTVTHRYQNCCQLHVHTLLTVQRTCGRKMIFGLLA